MEQRLLVIDGQQRQVDVRQNTAIGSPSLFNRNPKPRPVIVIEDDPRITLPGLDQGFEQLFPAFHAQYRQGDAAEIQHIVIRQCCQDWRGGRGGEAIAHGGFVAPIEETAFAGGVGLNAVQTRQTPGQTLDHAQADVFVGPALAHGIAETVIAQGGDIVHAAGGAQLTGQVHRGVQGVAAEALLQAAVGAVLQFDHAFADQGDARGVWAKGADGVHSCRVSGVSLRNRFPGSR
ncbi:hypothetical protein D3C84_593410 [compost metagenome]